GTWLRAGRGGPARCDRGSGGAAARCDDVARRAQLVSAPLAALAAGGIARAHPRPGRGTGPPARTGGRRRPLTASRFQCRVPRSHDRRGGLAALVFLVGGGWPTPVRGGGRGR